MGEPLTRKNTWMMDVLAAQSYFTGDSAVEETSPNVVRVRLVVPYSDPLRFIVDNGVDEVLEESVHYAASLWVDLDVRCCEDGDHLTDCRPRWLRERVREAVAGLGDEVRLIALIEFVKTLLASLPCPFVVTAEEEEEWASAVADHEERAYLSSEHECPICIETFIGSQMRRFGNCAHAACEGCLKNFVKVHMSESHVRLLVCPVGKCRAQLHPVVVHSMLAEAAIRDKYDALLLQDSLTSMLDVVYCPHATCSTPVVASDDMKACRKRNEGCLAECPKCLHQFCALCSEPWHAGGCHDRLHVYVSSVPTPEELRRQEEARAKKAEEEALRRDGSSIAWVKTHTRCCPGCNVVIEKNGGCDHMHCWRCKLDFSWSGATSRPDVVMRRFVERPREHFRNLVAADKEAIVCPRCRHLCRRTNWNNHIVCSGCLSGFCFLCHQIVKGTGHFSPAHPQHSVPTEEEFAKMAGEAKKRADEEEEKRRTPASGSTAGGSAAGSNTGNTRILRLPAPRGHLVTREEAIEML